MFNNCKNVILFYCLALIIIYFPPGGGVTFGDPDEKLNTSLFCEYLSG